jgi:hypothetical protein
MARIRSTHPGQWTDEDFVELSFPARLLAIAIRNHADDHGVIAWNPKTIKMQTFPADNVDVVSLLQELLDRNILRKEAHSGKEYGYIRNFARWNRTQKPSFTHPISERMLSYCGFGAVNSDTQHVSDRAHSGNGPPETGGHSNTGIGIVSPMEEGRGKREEGRDSGKRESSAASSSESPPRATATPPPNQPKPKPNGHRPAAPAAADDAAKGLADAKARLATPQKSAIPPPTADPQTLEPHQRLRVALSQILGPEPVSRWIGFPADFAAMLSAGFDVDLDIIPAIKDLKAVRGDRFRPMSLSYCFNAISDWYERRTGARTRRFEPDAPAAAKEPPPELRPVKTTNPLYDIDGWRDIVGAWKSDGKWEHWHDGHPPDHPDSFVPLKICEEFGIIRRPPPVVQAPSGHVTGR